MIEQERVIVQMERHFWRREQWFAKVPRSDRFWRDIANRARSETWIRYHLSHYDIEVLLAAFPGAVSHPHELCEPVDLSVGLGVLDKLVHHLYAKCRPGTEIGRRLDRGVDQMACLQFNSGVLQPLSMNYATITSPLFGKAQVSKFMLRPTETTLRFALVLRRTNYELPCTMGNYDQVSQWLATRLQESGKRK